MKPHKVVRTHFGSLWCWDKPRATQTHKTHHGPDLGGSHHLPPYSILCDYPRGWHPNGHFVPGLPGLPRGSPEIAHFGDSRDFEASYLSEQTSDGLAVWSKVVGLVETFPTVCRTFFCSQVFWVDSRLLVVGTQNWRTPGSSTPGPSFGHNLCFRCPNEQCEPIFDIYTSRPFHWYKGSNKPLSFDPLKRSLKFQESFWDSNSHQLPTWEFTWECEGSLPHTFSHSRE
jgi:hypothetical protein